MLMPLYESQGRNLDFSSCEKSHRSGFTSLPTFAVCVLKDSPLAARHSPPSYTARDFVGQSAHRLLVCYRTVSPPGIL